MRPLEFGGEFLPSKHAEPPGSAGISDGHEYEACLTDIFFPELVEWGPVLSRLCVPFQAALDIAVRAREGGRSFQSQLLVSGMVDEAAFVRAVAGRLGLAAIETIDPERLVINDRHAAALLRGRSGQVPVKLLERDGAVSFLITCERIDLKRLGEWLASHPALVKSLKMAQPRVLRAAIVARAQPLLAKSAVNRLFERFPGMSARVVANAWQGIMVGIALTALPVGFALAPDRTLATLHGLASFFFFACVMLRFAVVASARRAPPKAAVPVPEGDVPVYAVLVALYKEADIVPSLLVALDRIVWPRERLEVKLVCEADDIATLAVIAAMDLPSHIEVIEVPPCEPRTKPKALAYALAMTSAEFIALYDAEDWPEPMQLAEAWQRFERSGPELAVLQAPLEISNPSSGLIARMFAFEYAGLFRGMLPWLARAQLVFPLGGTSNHFRRAALDAVGGWDPFNVTEDADLGTRLARFGYRAEMIGLPTHEPAPDRFSVWLPQRTRWFKGWAQTWLVTMRSPMRLASELGPASLIVTQILFAGMLASALLHPVLLATFAVVLVKMIVKQPTSALHSALLAVDTVNIACGYLSFLLLGWQTLSKNEKRDFWKVVLFTPVYWAMLSYAGWRAVWQLWREPHRWEKTPHEQPARASPLAGAGKPAIYPGTKALRR